MNTALKVDGLIKQWKSEGIANTLLVKNLANACIGWPYIFGAAGVYCSPANRRSFYKAKGKETIKTKCENFNGTGYSGCAGCKWHPGGCVRAFDCQGFMKWLFKQIGITIKGSGCTSEYNNNSNWSEKGPIANMPKDKICLAFRYDNKTKKYEHVLLYDGEGHYIHDNGEVRKVAISKYSATHYAIPKGLYDNNTVVQKPSEEQSAKPTIPSYPTIKRGSKGEFVTQLQRLLSQNGYELVIDGIFGSKTEAAVKDYQKKNNLTVDGIVGPKTWSSLTKFK